MSASPDDLRAAVAEARDQLAKARAASEAATFDVDAAELALAAARADLHDSDPVYTAIEEAMEGSCLDEAHRDREAWCDAVDVFRKLLDRRGFVIARKPS